MDKDAMITYLIGELKEELWLHDWLVPEELEEKQSLLAERSNTRKPMAVSTINLTICSQVRKGGLNGTRWSNSPLEGGYYDLDAIVNAANVPTRMYETTSWLW